MNHIYDEDYQPGEDEIEEAYLDGLESGYQGENRCPPENKVLAYYYNSGYDAGDSDYSER